jgi:hypothetical protein
MPKVTVYIQNDLWKRIKERPGTGNVSQFVQKALEKELGVGGASIESDKARGIVDRMRSEARAIYDAGVRAGLDLAEDLDWSQLDRFQEVGWNVDDWLGQDKSSIESNLAQVISEWRDNHGPGSAKDQFVDYHLSASLESGSYKEGWVDALKGVWGAVMSDLRKTTRGEGAE